MPDKHGYPTSKEIAKLKKHAGAIGAECAELDTDKLLNLLRDIWRYPDFIKENGRHLELHTGGWSGNEEIIGALQESMFWLTAWRKSERGGHYYFELPAERS